VYVAGHYAYLGHLPNPQQLGTSIVDVSDPRKPRVVSQIHLDDPDSHSHKARVIGDLMIVNHERNQGPLGRKAENVAPQTGERKPYDQGGFRIYDVSDRTRPKLIPTGGPAASACTASTWTRPTPTSRPRWTALSATSW
jgi:hypothetical protein